MTYDVGAVPVVGADHDSMTVEPETELVNPSGAPGVNDAPGPGVASGVSDGDGAGPDDEGAGGSGAGGSGAGGGVGGGGGVGRGIGCVGSPLRCIAGSPKKIQERRRS